MRQGLSIILVTLLGSASSLNRLGPVSGRIQRPADRVRLHLRSLPIHPLHILAVPVLQPVIRVTIPFEELHVAILELVSKSPTGGGVGVPLATCVVGVQGVYVTVGPVLHSVVDGARQIGGQIIQVVMRGHRIPPFRGQVRPREVPLGGLFTKRALIWGLIEVLEAALTGRALPP